MRLLPWEEERLQLFAAAELARRHRAAGLRLNQPEAVALICDAMLEAARAGAGVRGGRGGRAARRSDPADVLDGVRELARRGPARGAPGRRHPGHRARSIRSVAATRRTRSGRGALRDRRPRPTSRVNDGRERDRARRHEHVPAPDPGLVALPVPPGQPAARVRSRRGARASTSTCRPAPGRAGSRARRRPSGSSATAARAATTSGVTRLSAEEYRARYGPTTGDRVRLGDTDLWIRVAEDRTAPRRRAGVGLREEPALADGPVGRGRRAVGARRRPHRRARRRPRHRRRQGRHRHQGRPDRRHRAGRGARRSATASTSSSARTRSRSWRYGLIATPGAVDSHVHTISPELLPPALVGRASRRSSRPGSRSRRSRWSGCWRGSRRGRSTSACRRARGRPTTGHLDELVEAGAVGFKIHEDNGAYPELIDAVLRYADARDLSVSLHTDGLHESAELEDTVAAIAGRTVHAYHVEGTGGGHVPDLLGLVREPSILCSSTTPTLPFGVHTAAEHVPMTVLNHGLSWDVPGDLELVRERDPRGADGRRGAAPRARRDRDRQLRLAGHGPDRRDGPPDVPAGPRHEGVAALRGGRRDPGPAAPIPGSTTRTTATTPRASCATSPR